MNRFILFGPPSVGKSTLLNQIAVTSHHCMCIDLEHIAGNVSDRMRFLHHLRGIRFKGPLFVGCADVHPRDFPDEFGVVLLWFKSKEEYLKRVARRNEERPEKANQDEEVMYGHIERWRREGKYVIEVDPNEFEGSFNEKATHVLEMLKSKQLLFIPT